MASARRSPLSLFLLLGLGAGIVILVWWLQQQRPAAVATATLVPSQYADLPGWNASDVRPALEAFRRSCAVIVHAMPQSRLGANGYAGTDADWQKVCGALPSSTPTLSGARAFFETTFAPVEIRPAPSSALFTGYYEPELVASRTHHGAYRTPIYGPPPNLVTVDLGAFRDRYKGQHLDGCLSGHRLLPCATRAEIDAGGLPGAPVLFYANDPVSVFFLHIQGSGRARLENGEMVRVAYAGQNGRPYTSVARTLIAQGLLPRDGMSLQAIRAWMKANPRQAPAVMETDQSFIFFEEQPLGNPALGSAGSEGVPLTPRASLAVDQRVHPLGAPFYVAATRPGDAGGKDVAFDQLLIAQDTGGAIRGPARGDVFWGFGPTAEAIAGRMKSTGRMFVLLPKPVVQRLHPGMKVSAP